MIAKHVLIAAILTSVAMSALPAIAGPPLPSDATRGHVTGDVAADLLMKSDGLDQGSALRDASLEREALAAIDGVIAAAGDAYSAYEVSHKPVFRLTVYVSRDVDEAAVRAAVSPALRSAIAFRKVRFNAAERRQVIDETSAKLRDSKHEFTVSYDLAGDRVEVSAVTDISDGSVLEAIPERARPGAVIKRGLHKKLNFYARPNGTKSGDATYGGWELYGTSASGSNSMCTTGFAGRDSYGDSVAVTAGHCVHDEAGVNHTLSTYTNGRQLVLPTEEYRAPSQSLTMDVAFLNMYGVQAEGGWVWVKNGIDPYNEEYRYFGYHTGRFIANSPNIVPNWTTGYAGVLDTRHSIGLGVTVCKTGVSTGMTCGKVTNDYYSGNTETGFVEVGQSVQMYIVAGGDSGGPVFSPPDANGNVYAYGIVHGSVAYNFDTTTRECVRPNDCRMTYMPIERVRDFQAGTIYTATGAVGF